MVLEGLCVQITGHKISLRDMQFKDLAASLHWLHPSHEWHKYNGPYYPPTPAEEIPDVVSMWAKRIAVDNLPTLRLRLMIVDTSDDVLGTVSHYWISEETNWLAIGISIWNPHNWNKGFGYEALGLWCAYLFENETKLTRLDARTWSGNKGMIRLAEKLGFSCEAVFRKARIVDGQYYDGLGYGILREEWEARYPNGFRASLS
jgi:putative hydrolase of HD superfamily